MQIGRDHRAPVHWGNLRIACRTLRQPPTPCPELTINRAS
jgi:hypothetical protein